MHQAPIVLQFLLAAPTPPRLPSPAELAQRPPHGLSAASQREPWLALGGCVTHARPRPPGAASAKPRRRCRRSWLHRTAPLPCLCTPCSPTSPAALLQKKKRTHLPDSEDPAKKGQPKSFVFRRGRHGALLRDLEKDLRKVRPGAAGLPCVLRGSDGMLLDFWLMHPGCAVALATNVPASFHWLSQVGACPPALHIHFPRPLPCRPLPRAAHGPQHGDSAEGEQAEPAEGLCARGGAAGCHTLPHPHSHPQRLVPARRQVRGACGGSSGRRDEQRLVQMRGWWCFCSRRPRCCCPSR